MNAGPNRHKLPRIEDIKIGDVLIERGIISAKEWTSLVLFAEVSHETDHLFMIVLEENKIDSRVISKNSLLFYSRLDESL